MFQILKVYQRIRDDPCGKKRQKHHKFGWSYGTDHPKNEDKMTFKFVAIQVQIHQTPKVSHGLGDAPCGKKGQKQSTLGWSYGTDHPARKHVNY